MLSLSSVAITTGQQDQLADGLDGVVAWANALDDHDLIAQSLPTVGQSVGESIDFGDLLNQGLAVPVANYLVGDPTPTTDELVSAIQALDNASFDNATLTVSNVDGGFDSASNEIVFDLEFQADRALSVNPSLGPEGDALGIDFSSTIGASSTLMFNFSFGLDLASGLTDEEAFFIRSASLSQEVDANVPAVATGPASIGFFAGQLTAGNLALDANMSVGIANPDSDAAGRVTLDELQSTELTSLVSLTESGTASGSVTIDPGTLGGFSPSGNSVISFNSSDPFTPPTLAFNAAYDEVRSFTNVSSFGFVGVLDQFSNWLDGLGNSEVLDARVELAGSRLGDLAPLDVVVDEGLIAPLLDANQLPTFATAQELASDLAAALGVGVGTINTQYNPTTKELTYRLIVNHNHAPTNVPVGFSADLDPVRELESQSTAALNATGGLDLTLGISLDDLSAVMTSTAPAPANGQISADSNFVLNLGLAGDVAVSLSAAATSGNSTRAEMVGDLNAAISAAGLSSSVVAGLDANNHLTFSTLGTSTGITAIELRAADYDPQGPPSTDPIVTELGFRERQLAFDSLANHAFIESATITGSASLSAADIDGTSRVGFLGADIVDGSGTSSAAFSLSVKNPFTQTAGGRANLFDLFEAQAVDITTVVDLPSLTGAVNVSLPLDAEVLGSALTTSPELTISWPDLGTGSPVVTLIDGSELEKFENLDGGSFAALFSLVQNFLENFESQQGGNFEIPGLGKSLSESSEAIGSFGTVIEKLNNDPAAGLEDVESWLENVLGLADQNLDLSLADNGDTVRIDLTFADSAVDQTPFQVAFPFIDQGQPSEEVLIGISGSGLLNFDVDYDFQLSLGIDVSNGINPLPFIYESSHFLAQAEVNTQNIDFSANIGPLGLFIRNGELLVDEDGNDTTRDKASFRIDLTDEDAQTSDGKIMLGDIGFENASASLTGQVNIVLPMFFPFQSDYIGDFEFRIADLSDPLNTTTVVVPDLEEEEQEQENGLVDNVTAILNGLDGWFEIAIDAFNGKVGGFDLPFVGKDLNKVADFLEEVQEDVIDQITDRFRETEGNTAAALQTALYLAVGPDGLNILKDRDLSGTVTIDDIHFTTEDADQDNKIEEIEFFMELGQNLTVLDTPIDFDIGLPGLGLDVDGDLEILVGYDWDLSFGLSNEYGFYLLTNQEDEIEIDLEVRIPDLEARGELAFLQLDVSDEDADGNPNNDGADVDMDGRDPSSFVAGLAIDFLDPINDTEDPNDDGKMVETEIEKLFTGDIDVDDAINVELVGEAELNLDLLVSFEGDTRFPSIGSEFTVLWSFLENNDPPEAEDDLEGELPTVAFTNITLNAGEFISDFADGVLKEVQKFTEPIQPVVDFVTSPVPILSDFGFDLTPIDVAEALGYATEAGYVEAIADLISAINSVPEVSDQLMIPLGDFVIVEPGGEDTDLREEGATENAMPEETPPAMTPVDKLKEEDEDAGDFFDDLKALGIELPLLEDPTSVFQLLLGQDVDLFLYDVPKLEVSFPFPIVKIGPIIPPIPLFASISGSVGASVDLAVGFDTHGFQQASKSDDWWDVFNGFYISDTANPDGSGEDVVEATLFGNLNAAAELSLVVAGAGVSGGVDLFLTADLVDTNNDGKVHLDELIANIPLGVTGTFDLGGQITARLDAFVEILFKRQNFTIAEFEIASFEFTDEDIFTDRFSGNNSFSNAKFLGAGPGLHIDGLSLETLGDVDWYEFELLRPDSIEVDIRHSSVHGDIDIEVYDSNQQLIAEGKSGEDREFAELVDVPAGNYFVKVSGVNKLNNYQLAVEPGDTSDTRVIYVTPSGALDRGNAYFTIAPGDDKHDGLSYRKPKATLQDVLDDYDLGPNDVIVLETGTHATGGIITTADEGALYLGTRAGSTLSDVRLENANNNYFHRVNFQSNSPGLTLFGSDNNVFDLANFNGTGVNLVIDDSDNNLVDRSTFAGLSDGVHILGDANDDAVGNIITRSEFQNVQTAVDILSFEVNTLDGNTFTGNGSVGVHLRPGTPAVLVGNDISGRATGIRWESRVADVWDNDIHAGTVGIEVLGGVVGPDNPAPYGAPGGLTPNRVFANSTGVLVPESSAGAVVRHTDINSNTLGVDASGDQTQLVANDIHNNTTGVSSSRVVGPDSWEINLSNLIHDNTTGVEALPGAEVRFNRIFANEDGIEVLGTANVHHNLIYRNTGSGLLISGAVDVDVINNTIYVPSGNGVELEGPIEDVRIKNNIVSADAGFGLFVDPESQFGYESDFNNWYATGSGGLAFQGKGFFDLYDWQVEAESDLNSIGVTAPHPLLDVPRFVNQPLDDYRLLSNSTSIDAGDPASSFGLEPLANGNRINLGAYGNTPQATQSPAQRLEITAPNFYVDLVPSLTNTLAWESNNLGGGANLDIDLIEEGVGKVADIATVAASAGSTTWTPGNFVSGDNAKRYRVRLTTLSGPLLVEESREAFAIVDHDPSAANTFYVNDASTTDDVYTTAVGDNRNTGLTADAPKVVIRPLVLSYAMSGGDVVQVDTGDYIHAVNLNLALNPLPEDPRMNSVTATTIEGPSIGPGVARIDRANPFPGSTAVDIIGSNLMTLEDLTVVGAETGLRVRDSAILLDADRLVISDHSRDGLSIENGSSLADLRDLEVFNNGRHGIFVDSSLGTLADSTIYDNVAIGAALRSVGGGSVVRNEVYQNFRGIDIINPGSSTSMVGNSALPLEDGNRVHHNEEDGIFASGNVLVAGNLVHENANIGIRLEDGADATQNVVHQHTIGISARGSSSLISENRSYENSVTGIEASFDSNVLRNVTYSNDLHGIHADRFSGVIDHNLVYATGYASMNVEGPGQGAQITHNTVYEPCAAADTHDPAAPATVVTEWDMNIFMDQFAPPNQAFNAMLWGSATFEFQDAVGNLGGTFDLGPGGGTGAQTAQPLPTDETWTIDYDLLSLDLSSFMSEPIPGVGFVEATLMEGPSSFGQMELQNIGGTLVGTNHMELWIQFFFTDTATTLIPDTPVIIDYSVTLTDGFGELDALQVSMHIPSSSSAPGFLFNAAAPSDGWLLDLQDADVTGPPDPPPQDLGETCAEIGVLIQNHSDRVHLRQNAIFVQGDPNPEPGDPISVDIVVDSTSTNRFDSDFNALMTDYGIVGTFAGAGAPTLTDWQNITGEDLHSISPNPGTVWVDPDGDDNALAGLASGNDDNFHARSPFGHVDKGALAPVTDPALSPLGLPQFTPVVWVTTGGGIAQLSALVDAGDPSAAFFVEPAENGKFANIGAYGNTSQASNSEPEYIHLAYPIGAEQIVPGQTYEIVWRSHDHIPGDTVEIELTHGGIGGPVETVIDPAAPNTGSYFWTVDPATPIDNDYTIVITRPSVISPGAEIEGDSPFRFDIDGDNRPPIVLGTTPPIVELERSTNANLSSITVDYSENVLGGGNSLSYSLIGAGTNGIFDGVDDVTYTLNVTYNPAASDGILSFVTLDIVGGPLPEGNFRLTVNSGFISDNAGNVLDGALNGGSSNYVRTFTIDQTAPTVMIPAISPDPRNDSVNPLAIVFDEPVVGVGLADVRLTLDGGPNLLGGTQALASTDSITWELSDTTALTEAEGTYTLELTALDSNIRDLAGNPLTLDASTSWTVDTTAPRVDIVDVSPDPRNSAVGQIDVVFSEEVQNFTVGDLELLVDGTPIGLTAAQAPTTSDNITWTIGNLSGLTASEGSYLLKIKDTAGLTDLVGNGLAAEEREVWQVLLGAPAVDIVDVSPDPRTTSVDEVVVSFDVPVTGFDADDLALTRDGNNVSLTGQLTVTSLDAMNYHVTGFSAVTAANGQYVLTLDSASSGIQDFAGNALTGVVTDAWLKDDVAPTVAITPVSPDPTNQTIDQLTITFSKPVTGLTLTQLTLTRDSLPVGWDGSQTVTTANGITWTLANLAPLTAAAGTYELTLDASSGDIEAFPGNPLAVGDTESWVHDPVIPTVAISDVTPNASLTPNDSVEFVFSEPVLNFDKSDLVVRHQGSEIALTAAQTLTTSDNQTWTLNNLAPLTNAPGKYEVSLPAFSSGITDGVTNKLDVGTFETWRVLLAGDGDLDVDVDGSDFLQWQRGNNDADGDGDTDADDLAIWRANYPTAAPSVAPISAATSALAVAVSTPQSAALTVEPTDAVLADAVLGEWTGSQFDLAGDDEDSLTEDSTWNQFGQASTQDHTRRPLLTSGARPSTRDLQSARSAYRTAVDSALDTLADDEENLAQAITNEFRES